MAKTIKKDKVSELLAKLSGYDVYAPVMVEGSVSFKKIENDMQPSMDYRQAQRPPKSVFFPQTEKMFELVRDGQRFIDIKEPAKEGKPIAVFGIRPCDARAAAMLDKVFGGTAPYVATWLVARTGNDVAPAYYVIAAAIVSLLTLLTIGETAGRPLRRLVYADAQ